MKFLWDTKILNPVSKEDKFKAQEESRRIKEREDYEKRELDCQEYERRELDRRKYEKDENERREKIRMKHLESLMEEEHNNELLLNKVIHENKMKELERLSEIEAEKRAYEANQTQKVIDFNSLCAGKNIKFISHENKLIIDADIMDTTGIKVGGHQIRGSEIELEAGDGVVINTIHPNKIKITLDAYKFIGGIMDRISKIEKLGLFLDSVEQRVTELEKGE